MKWTTALYLGLAIAGLIILAYSPAVGVLASLLGVGAAARSQANSIDRDEKQATQEQLDEIEEAKHGQVEDYQNDPDGLADYAQSVIDRLRSDQQ